MSFDPGFGVGRLASNLIVGALVLGATVSASACRSPEVDHTSSGAATPVASQSGAPDRARQPRPQTATAPLFYRAEVGQNDTWASIAATYGIEERYLRGSNPDLAGGPLAVGASIDVPGVPGVLHTVQAGDTVDGVAAQYSVDPASILDHRPNGLDGANPRLVAGKIILVPGGTRPSP